MSAPRVSLDGPVPQPPRFGLLSVAQIVDDLDQHWMGGAVVRPYPPGQANVHDPCATGSTAVKAVAADAELAPFGGYTVYLADQCTGRGIGDVAEFRARLAAALAATEGAAVEAELMVGAGLGTFPHVTDTDLVQLHSGTSTSPENGLALLEDAIGDTGKAGVIHASPSIATAWRARNLIEPSGTTMYAVASGNPVAVGRGYIGVRPDGESAPSACQGWAFATGPIQVRRSEAIVNPPDIAGAMDRALNDITFYAERDYLHIWDRELQAGVLIDRGATGCS